MSAATWLITGASSGVGYALAEHVLKQNDEVVLAARTMHSMQALATSFPKTALAVQLDVTNPEHRANVVRQTETRFGSIDVLVNNAGIDYLGAIEGLASRRPVGLKTVVRQSGGFVQPTRPYTRDQVS